jgi:hypothetical protein
MAWRENNRRVSNGEQYLTAADAALQHPVSRQWKGVGGVVLREGQRGKRPRPMRTGTGTVHALGDCALIC